MTFNQLVKRVISESENSIPAHAVIHSAHIYLGSSPHLSIHSNIDDEYGKSDWADWYREYGANVVYESENFEDSLETLSLYYEGVTEQDLPQHIVDEIRQKMKDYIGVWRVIDDSANAGALSLSVLDVHSHSPFKHAAADLLGF